MDCRPDEAKEPRTSPEKTVGELGPLWDSKSSDYFAVSSMMKIMIHVIINKILPIRFHF
jgi:hypothetical protein